MVERDPLFDPLKYKKSELRADPLTSGRALFYKEE